LHERLEQRAAVIFRDADAGVDDVDRQQLVGAARDLDRDVAGGRELQRVADQDGEDLAHPLGVDVEPLVPRQLDAQIEREAALDRRGAERLGEALQRRHAVVGGAVHVDPARFELRVLEDVADQRLQGAGAEIHGLEVLALVLPQGAVAQQVDHRAEAVQRGADLVAHHGQEPRLGVVGGARAGEGCLQFAAQAFGGVESRAGRLHAEQQVGGRIARCEVGQLQAVAVEVVDVAERRRGPERRVRAAGDGDLAALQFEVEASGPEHHGTARVRWQVEEVHDRSRSDDFELGVDRRADGRLEQSVQGVAEGHDPPECIGDETERHHRGEIASAEGDLVRHRRHGFRWQPAARYCAWPSRCAAT
jgi:hypothetical protein